MKRSLTLYNPATDETRQVRDVSGNDDQELFAIKFEMMCKSGDPWIVVDSADMQYVDVERRYG